MKLKPVVASLVVLGLMTPVFAKDRYHHHHKDVTASQQAVIDQNSVVSPVCPEGWFNRISVGGLGSVVGIVGNRDQAGTFGASKNSTDLFLNNANLLVNANLSDWSKATLNLGVLAAPKWTTGDNLSSRNYNIVADEAYVTFANLAKSPFHVSVGKKYIPFGEYSDPYEPIQIMSPAQMLAQTNAVALIAGLTSNFGLYTDVFAFRGETSPDGDKNAGNIRNFGARIGYYNDLASVGAPNSHINFAASYINNLWDSQVFSPNAEPQRSFQSKSYKKGISDGYAVDRVGGVSVHGDFTYEAFSMYADWVASVKNMVADKTSLNSSSKFYGANVNAEYAFNTLNRNSFVNLGVQWSGNGQWFATNVGNVQTDWALVVPKWRLVGEYQVNILKNTDLGFVVAHGKSYDLPGRENSGCNSTLGLARLMFQF